MTTLLPVQCYACVRLDRTLGTEGFSDLPVVARCEAFPRQIPAQIALGADHREPVGGEVGGMVFSPLETEQGREAFRWWEKGFGDQDG